MFGDDGREKSLESMSNKDVDALGVCTCECEREFGIEGAGLRKSSSGGVGYDDEDGRVGLSKNQSSFDAMLVDEVDLELPCASRSSPLQASASFAFSSLSLSSRARCSFIAASCRAASDKFPGLFDEENDADNSEPNASTFLPPWPP